MRLALVICCCVACISIAAFFSSASLTVIQIGRTASQVEDSAREIRQGISAPLAKIDATAGNLEVVSGQIRDLIGSEKSQRSLGLLIRSGDDINRIFKRTNETLDILQEGIRNTDNELNRKTLPAATAAIQQTEAATRQAVSTIAEIGQLAETAKGDLHSTAAALADTLDGARKSVSAAIEAIESMRVIAEGPIAESAKNVERGTLAAAETLENTRKITERWARPPRLIWSVLSSIGSFAYRTFLKP
jgi:hypothetical protein